MTAHANTVGLLHPGAMGAAVGAQLTAAATRTLWVTDGRGQQSRERAEAAGLVACARLEDLAGCSTIISVCPPAAALDVAKAVAATPFAGTYVDANAISPRHAQEIEALFDGRAEVVDGGIVGSPPKAGGNTRLYLSGAEAAVARVQDLFTGTELHPVVLPGPVGRASALKLSFASYNKLTYALAAQAYALAEHHGVAGELRELAGTVLPGTPFGQPDGLVSAGRRAWRWEGEMAEIGAACQDAGLPDALLVASEALFARWSQYKEDNGDLTFEQLLAALAERA
jgi:3-hydroxyisobutyrate dehydrogenase-like beta-hydroxyacid dehydrogenase